MSSDLYIQQVVTHPAVRRGGKIEPNKICALKTSFQDERRRSRQAYRQWKTAMRGTANLTLAQYRPSEKGAS